MALRTLLGFVNRVGSGSGSFMMADGDGDPASKFFLHLCYFIEFARYCSTLSLITSPIIRSIAFFKSSRTASRMASQYAAASRGALLLPLPRRRLRLCRGRPKYLMTETTISHQASRASWQTEAPSRKRLEMTRSTLKTTILLQRTRGKAKPRSGSGLQMETVPLRKRYIRLQTRDLTTKLA